MKRITEQNRFHNTNLYQEYAKIEYMLSGYKVICKSGITGLYPENKAELTIENFVDVHFLNWHLRGTLLNVHEMRYVLGISREKLNDDITEEQLPQFLHRVR